MLISQSCAAYPEEAKALIQVEKQGIVREMANAPDEPSREKMAESWVQRLIDQGNLNDPDARWALNAWTGALKKSPVPQNQPSGPQAWSEANFEAATRTPEDRKNAASTGAKTGVITGLFIIYCLLQINYLVLAFAPQFGDGLPWVVSIPLALLALVLAGWIGWRIGPGFGYLQREVTGTIVGAFLGVLGGGLYFRFLAGFLDPVGNPVFDTTLRLFTGILVGAFAGAGIGFLNQFIIRAIRKHLLARYYYYGYGPNPYAVVTDDMLDARDEMNRRMGL
jgi:hypothetical protein